MADLVQAAKDWQALIGMVVGVAAVVWRLGVKGGSISAKLDSLIGWVRRLETRVENAETAANTARDRADRAHQQAVYLKGRLEGLPPEAAERMAEEQT